MKRLLLRLLFGQSLRHRAVALRRSEQRPVRATAAWNEREEDITARLFPVSLNPLIFGIAWERGTPPTWFKMRMEDGASLHLLGTIAATSCGMIDHPTARIALFRSTDSSVSCMPRALLMLKYALAWRQAQRSRRDPRAFQMSFADLRALNVFYMAPRPVYLISFMHDGASNIFPMDLVGPLGDNHFLLALRLTSPSVELMVRSGRIVAARAPAVLKQEVYQLGGHHKERAIDWDTLPIAVEPSPLFGIPTPSDHLGRYELEVIHNEPVGSHMFFVTSIAATSDGPDEPQLAHVSDMYARWRSREGRSLLDA